jgi:hypothetical protein
LTCQIKTLTVSLFYRPPKTDEVYIQNYIKEILELKTRYDKAIFCVGGDFNLPDIDWKTGLVNGNNYPHKTSEKLSLGRICLWNKLSNVALEEKTY